MSSQWVRYGADHIVGYVDDVKTLDINPSSISIPAVKVSTDSSFPEPTEGKNAATKGYVDSAIAAATMGQMPDTLSLTKLDVGLLKVTGQCAVPTPSQSTDAATKAYVDTAVAAAAIPTNLSLTSLTTGTATVTGNASVAGTLSASNAAVSGSITVPAPTASSHAATKAYVDSAVTSGVVPQNLSLTTLTVSGSATVPTPSAASHAATKAYVDAVAVQSLPQNIAVTTLTVSGSATVPTPTDAGHAVTKAYLDTTLLSSYSVHFIDIPIVWSYSYSSNWAQKATGQTLRVTVVLPFPSVNRLATVHVNPLMVPALDVTDADTGCLTGVLTNWPADLMKSSSFTIGDIFVYPYTAFAQMTAALPARMELSPSTGFMDIMAWKPDHTATQNYLPKHITSVGGVCLWDVSGTAGWP